MSKYIVLYFLRNGKLNENNSIALDISRRPSGKLTCQILNLRCKNVPSKGINVDEDLKFRREFHMKEWESLREEIGSQIDHSRNLELATVVGVATFYAWFFSVKPQPLIVILLLPSLLTLLAGLRAWGTLKRIEEIATYIKTIEKEFCLNKSDLMGWEHFRCENFKQSSFFKFSAVIFWGVLLIVSLLALLIFS